MVLIIPAGLRSWFKNIRKSVFGVFVFNIGSRSAIPYPMIESDVLFSSHSYTSKCLPLCLKQLFMKNECVSLKTGYFPPFFTTLLVID